MSEHEERMARIESLGVSHLLIVDENGKVIRSNKQNDKDPQAANSQAATIASSVAQLARKARSVVRDLDPLNDLVFFRVRAKTKEVMVAPSEHLFLIVIQDDKEEKH